MKVSFLVTYYNQKDPTINAAIDTFKEKNCGWILGFQLKMVGSILTKVLFPQKRDLAEEQMYTKCGN
jgi:hypothetical protein